MNTKTTIKSLLLMACLFVGMASCKKNTDAGNDINHPTPSPDPVFTGPNTNAANLSVRVIYLVPADRTLNKQYTAATADCATQLTAWYKTTLGSNKTFHLNRNVVETIQSTHAAAWFNANNGSSSGTDAQFYFYSNAKTDIKALLGAGYDESKYIYLVYVDALGTTGAGAIGFTAMPENDLKGLTGNMTEPVSRWIGGAGHEIGHAFGLPHPTDQDPNALMWTGYTLYPNCILKASDKTTLNANKFFY